MWQRMAWLAASWLIGAPFFWMLTALMGPWVLVILIPALWASWDYFARGDMVGPVDRVSAFGKFLPDALSRRDDS
jgi:hypothetical protein